MADTSTADDIAQSLRARADELREQLAGYQDLRDELDRLEAALEALAPDGDADEQG
jgi:hypothetical protein